MELLDFAVQKAGYKPGADIAINLDPAASELYKDGAYVFHKSGGEKKTSAEMIDFWADWTKKYPEIFSLEDSLAEDDWTGWQELRREFMQIVSGSIEC